MDRAKSSAGGGNKRGHYTESQTGIRKQGNPKGTIAIPYVHSYYRYEYEVQNIMGPCAVCPAQPKARVCFVERGRKGALCFSRKRKEETTTTKTPKTKRKCLKS